MPRYLIKYPYIHNIYIMDFIKVKLLKTKFNSNSFCYKNFPCYITNIGNNCAICAIHTLPPYNNVVTPIYIIDNNNNKKIIYYKIDIKYYKKVIYNVHFYKDLKYTPFSVYKIKKINKDDLILTLFKNKNEVY